jgi:hypothetical protein
MMSKSPFTYWLVSFVTYWLVSFVTYCHNEQILALLHTGLLALLHIIVAWSLVALWLLRFKAMIFNDDRDYKLHIMAEIGIYC